MLEAIQLMYNLGYRFTGAGSGYIYFVENRGTEFREFKSWGDVRNFIILKQER